MDKNGLIKAMQATASLKPRKVFVEGWGDLFVKSLTVAEVQAQQERNQDADVKDKRTLAIGAANIICDENGVLVFDSNKKEDIDLLSMQPWAMLSKVITASSDFNGLSEAGQEEAKKG
jgi:hypothetical protein